MAQTPPPSIPQAPPPPIRKDRRTFSDLFEAFLLWLTTAVSQFNALASNVYNNALDAFSSATSAANSATVAITQATNAESIVGIMPWVSGTTYAKNAAVISQVNFQSYRRMVAGAGTTDPANDATNWRIIANGSSNFVPVVMAANSVNYALGDYFIKTEGGSTVTLSLDNVPPGGSTRTIELRSTAPSGTITVSFAQGAAVGTSFNRPLVLAANKTHLIAVISSTGTKFMASVGESFPL